MFSFFKQDWKHLNHCTKIRKKKIIIDLKNIGINKKEPNLFLYEGP
jgi:hypothetical protein